METTHCPICQNEDCDDLIIDLKICNSCSHIFKKILFRHKVLSISEIHKLQDPVQSLRGFIETPQPAFELRFPSMMFFTLDLNPSSFYKAQYNHYFNQRSLMILLKRCGLVPKIQENRWDGKISETIVIVEPEK